MFKIILGVIMGLIGVWAAAYATEVLGPWADLPSLITGAVFLTLGIFTAFVGAAEVRP